MKSSTSSRIDWQEVAGGYCRFSGPGLPAPVLVETKATTNTRDLRDSLLNLAYLLEEPQHHGDVALCLLINSRLSADRLTEELQSFRGILASHLKERIFLTAMSDGGAVIGALPGAKSNARPHALLPVLQGVVGSALKQGGRKVNRQVVKSTLINRWLRGDGRQTTSSLQRDTGASRPTVQAALSDLRRLKVLDQLPAPLGISLHKMPWSAWRALVEEHASRRRTYHYVDGDGLARSAMQLAKRLRSMQQQGRAIGVALGGVIGARHYDDDLDVTAPSRLDLSIHDKDISFVRELDAGLQLSDDPHVNPVLVVHQTIDKEEFENPTRNGLIASPMDCLADLLECGLIGQAEEFSWRLNKMAEENGVK
ncbi:MAG TPA: hypothetical protein VGM81_00965 [Burkholderiaceae bacterium]|jgi:hypothetical protein